MMGWRSTEKRAVKRGTTSTVHDRTRPVGARVMRLGRATSEAIVCDPDRIFARGFHGRGLCSVRYQPTPISSHNSQPFAL